MMRFRKSLWMAALIGAVLLGPAPPARATIQMMIQEDSGTVTTITGSNGFVSFNGAFGDFSIVASFGTSNAPGGQNALVQLGTFSVTNNASGNGSHVLNISVSGDGFNSPQSPPPLEVLDTVSGSGVNGTLFGNFQGYADATNTLFGKGFASTNLGFSVSGTSQSFHQDGVQFGFSPDGATYSLSTFATYSLSNGGSFTLSGGNVQAVVPAPAGLMLVLSGLPLLGLGWLRRRRQPA
jgi:hypothetical protein